MRVLAFTPFGGSKYAVPPAIDLTLSSVFKTNYVETIRSAGAMDSYGDTSPGANVPFEFPFVIPCFDQQAVDDMYSAFSKRGWLDVQFIDGSIRSTVFKPESLDVVRSYGARKYLPVKVKGTKDPGWRSYKPRALTGSGTSFTIHTNGNADVFTLLTITLGGQSGSVPQFTLTNTTNNYALQWVGTVALLVGQTLTINPGAATVKRSTGSDEWPQVTLGTQQVGFFKLAPGDNTITVSPSLPAGSVWTFSFRDAWYG